MTDYEMERQWEAEMEKAAQDRNYYDKVMAGQAQSYPPTSVSNVETAMDRQAFETAEDEARARDGELINKSSAASDKAHMMIVGTLRMHALLIDKERWANEFNAGHCTLEAYDYKLVDISKALRLLANQTLDGNLEVEEIEEEEIEEDDPL